MLLPTVLAALAVLPAISAQTTTSSSFSTGTVCRTLYTIFPVPTGSAGVPTYTSYATTTEIAQVTYTTRDTITVTPAATTFTDVVTTTTVITTTTTSTPDSVTVPTLKGFIPLRAGPTATAMSRVKRLELDARAPTHPLKRQTPDGYSAGFIAYPNGTYSGLYSRSPYRVDCDITVVVFATVITIEYAEPATDIAPQQTATSVATTTVSSTTTVTEVAPTPTEYAACGDNNVVNHIPDVNGIALFFSQIIYRPTQGFPVGNGFVMDVDSPRGCCEACQNTQYCAGSFYATGVEECHLRLTQPYVPPPIPVSGNTTTIASPTDALIPISTGTPSPSDNGTCSTGSLSSYLGVIEGSESFPANLSLYVSNGPCGRFSVDPVPIEMGGTVAPLPAKRGIAAF